MRSNLSLDRPLLISAALIVLILLASSLVFPQVLTAKYLLQQLQIASFFGVLAAGSMMVILLGHIDLSIPWTMSVAAIIATAFAGLTGEGTLAPLSIPQRCSSVAWSV